MRSPTRTGSGSFIAKIRRPHEEHAPAPPISAHSPDDVAPPTPTKAPALDPPTKASAPDPPPSAAPAEPIATHAVAVTRTRCECRAAGHALCKREDLGRVVCECRMRDGTQLFAAHAGGVMSASYPMPEDYSIGRATGFLCGGFHPRRSADGGVTSGGALDGNLTACHRGCSDSRVFSGVAGHACRGVDERDDEVDGVLACP